MIRVGEISHPEEVIDKKAKLFYDYFHYCISNKRDFVTFNLESHLTILDCVIFRLDNFLGHSSTKTLITEYLNHHPLFDTKKDIIFKKENPKRLISEIRRVWQNKNKDIIQLREKIELLKKCLNDGIHKEANIYFKAILYNLIEILGDKHDFEFHKRKIIYYTHLLVAEFIREEFSLEDLERIFSRILSNELIFDKENKKNVFFMFPLPEEIEQYRNTDEFIEKVESFLQNRTFREQFEGIYSIYDKVQKGDFLIRVDKVRISTKNTSLIFQIDNVDFLKYQNLTFNKTYWKEYELKKLEEFLDVKDSMIAKVNLNYKSLEKAHQTALFRVKNALGAFNFNFGRGGELFEEKFYVLSDYGGRYSWRDKSLKISWWKDEERIKVSPLLSVDEAVDCRIKELLTKCDNVLFRAYSSKYWDDEILYYWRYLEAVFSIAKIKAEKIITFVARILINSEVEYQKENLKDAIFNILNNSDSTVISSSIIPQELRLELNDFDEFDITQVKTLTNYDFILSLAEKYEKAYKSIDFIDCERYYHKSFKELYEQRNTILHQGMYCFSTIQSLQTYMPIFLKRIRNTIITFANQNPEIKSPTELIKQLTMV